MVIRTTPAAAFGSWISVLQARHVYVSDLSLGLRRAITPVIARNKAVSIGAVSYYVDHFVTTRIAKFTCGSPCNTAYNSSDPEHIQRFDNSYVDAMGNRWVSGFFRTMLSRVRHGQS